MVYLCPQKLWKLGDCCQPPFNIVVEASPTEWPGFRSTTEAQGRWSQGGSPRTAARDAAGYDGLSLSTEAPETRPLLPAAFQHHSRCLCN